MAGSGDAWMDVDECSYSPGVGGVLPKGDKVEQLQ